MGAVLELTLSQLDGRDFLLVDQQASSYDGYPPVLSPRAMMSTCPFPPLIRLTCYPIHSPPPRCTGCTGAPPLPK